MPLSHLSHSTFSNFDPAALNVGPVAFNLNEFRLPPALADAASSGALHEPPHDFQTPDGFREFFIFGFQFFNFALKLFVFT
jgi:hypothetical protein